MTMIFNTHLTSLTHLFDYINQFWGLWLQQFPNNIKFSLLPLQKPKRPNLTLAKNKSRSTQCHNLNNLDNIRVHNATYQFSRSSTYWFWRWKLFSVFLPYIGMGAILVIWSYSFVSISFPFTHKLSYEIWFQWLNSFREKQVLIFKSEWPLAKVK